MMGARYVEGESGIYEIRNLASGNRYIGSALNFGGRWSVHRSSLRRGVHRSKVLQRAWDKHGEAAFEFRRLLVCAPENLLFYEQRCIDAYAPEYNQYKIAGSPLGRKWTEEQKARLREVRARQPKRVITPENRAAMNAARKGMVFSAEHRAAIGAAHRGRKASEETRARMSAAQKGRVVSAEARERQAAALRGRKMDEATKAKISQALKGRKNSPEHNAKIAATKRARAAAKKQEAANGAQA